LFKLSGDGELRDAREYADCLVDLFPHSLTYAGAAMTCFGQAAAIGWDHPDTERILREFLRLFHEARSGYERLTPVEQRDAEVCEIMRVTYGAAVLVAGKLHDRTLAATISDEAIKYWPESAENWVTRAGIRYPEQIDIHAARRAAELGAVSYTPYYFLSQVSFDQGDYASALMWAEKASAKLRPMDAGAPRVHGWVAACLAMSGQKEMADTSFRKAVSLDPSDQDLQSAYEFFRTSPPEEESQQLAIRLKQTTPEIPVNFPLVLSQQEHRVENLLAVTA